MSYRIIIEDLENKENTQELKVEHAILETDLGVSAIGDFKHKTKDDLKYIASLLILTTFDILLRTKKSEEEIENMTTKEAEKTVEEFKEYLEYLTLNTKFAFIQLYKNKYGIKEKKRKSKKNYFCKVSADDLQLADLSFNTGIIATEKDVSILAYEKDTKFMSDDKKRELLSILLHSSYNVLETIVMETGKFKNKTEYYKKLGLASNNLEEMFRSLIDQLYFNMMDVLDNCIRDNRVDLDGFYVDTNALVQQMREDAEDTDLDENDFAL